MVVRTDEALGPDTEEILSQVDQAFDDPDLTELGQVVNSILVADCGSSFTRVSLLERTDTGFCFVAHAMAPTTTQPPWSDVSIGVRHAVDDITNTTRRILFDETGALIVPETGGRGVDLFVVTCSATQPLRVVLAGLVSQVSLASLKRAAASSYVEVLDVIARDYLGPQSDDLPDDGPAVDGLRAKVGAPKPEVANVGAGLSDEDRIAIIRQHRPDVVWVAGGTDGGSHEPVRDLVETMALACALVDGPRQPAIVYAGNADLRSEIVQLISDEVELEIVDNVHPTLDVENLAPAQAAFQAAYVKRKVRSLPGMGSLIGWSRAPVLPTAQASSYLVRYLERLYESDKGVLWADVGSSNTAIAASFPTLPGASRSASGDDHTDVEHVLRIGTGLGVGHGAPALLEQIGLDAIVRWLPFRPEPGEVEEVLLNKGVRPTTIPPDRRQLLIEQAAAREALRQVMRRVRESWQTNRGGGPSRWLMPLLEPIIASGGVFVGAPRPSQAVLMLLDAVEPVGVTTIVLDEHGLASALGAVAVTQPLAAVQALDTGTFSKLATVVAPVGRARLGEMIMQVRVSFERGGELEIEVEYGSLEMLPLYTDEKAIVELKPRRGIRVGRASKAVEVSGSAVGLVIDARGRPLRLPSNLDRCRQLAQRWLWEMGA